MITAAALIMAAVFGAFILDDQIFLKIIGIGMAAAVVIDAVIIRLLLVPAVMQLLRRPATGGSRAGSTACYRPSTSKGRRPSPSPEPAPTRALENV